MSCASILLTMISRSRSRWAAHFIMCTAIGSIPVVALITTAAVSTASSAGSDWPRKSGAPGVSMMCAWMPPWRRCTIELFRDRWALRSSGSQSLTVLPRSTVPGAPIAPDFQSRASTRLVLPAVAGPTRARVLRAAISADNGMVIPPRKPHRIRCEGRWQEGGTRGPWSLLYGNASMLSQRSRPGQDSPGPRSCKAHRAVSVVRSRTSASSYAT